jgi:hypothetical protein
MELMVILVTPEYFTHLICNYFSKVSHFLVPQALLFLQVF